MFKYQNKFFEFLEKISIKITMKILNKLLLNWEIREIGEIREIM